MAEFNEWYATYESLEHNVTTDKNQEALAERIFKNITTEANLQISKPRTIKIWPRIAIAASFALIVGMGVLYYSDKQAQEIKQTAYLKI